MMLPFGFLRRMNPLHSGDLDDMRDAFEGDGPHDALGHMRATEGPAARAEKPRSGDGLRR